MQESMNNIAFGFIIVGAALSLGRDYWSAMSMKLYSKIKKRAYDERLAKAVAIYLMLTGMIFTIIGLLGMFNVIKY